MKTETLDSMVGRLCEFGGPQEAINVAWARLAHVHEGLGNDQAVEAVLIAWYKTPEVKS